MFDNYIFMDVNYGDICKYEIDGVVFYTRPLMGKLLDLNRLEMETEPVLHADHDIKVAISAWRDINVWAGSKTDVEAIAKAISKHFEHVKVSCCARVLQIWREGDKSINRQLSDFYVLSPEDKERYSL